MTLALKMEEYEDLVCDFFSFAKDLATSNMPQDP